MHSSVISRVSRVTTRYLSLGSLAGVSWSLIRTGLVLGISFVILYPLMVSISASLMQEADLYDRTVRWIPRQVTGFNYWAAYVAMRYPAAFLRSAGLSVTVSVLQLLVCSMIGYGLARYRFAGRNALFALVILMLLVPPQVIMIPMFLNFRFFRLFGLIGGAGLNLINTVWPIVLPAATGAGFKNGLYIYIMRQYFKGLPKDLEEAAYVDGAGPLKVFFRVMLPGAGPVLVTVLLLSFVWQWNDYFYTSMFLRDADYLPLTLIGMDHQTWFRQAFGAGTPNDMFTSLVSNAGIVMFTVPLLVVYAFLQRYFVESIEWTGLVG